MNKEILDFNLCKRLYEAGVRVETEKGYPEDDDGEDASYCHFFDRDNGDFYIPALTIVNGLELMKENSLRVGFLNYKWYVVISSDRFSNLFRGIDIKDCVEQTLTYLLDNGHIGTKYIESDVEDL